MANEQLHTVLRHLRTAAATQGSRDLPDVELLQRFGEQRDAAAFTALVQRHGRLVLNVCRHVLHHHQDAEDAFQATFLVLARNAASIRKGQAVGSWLHGVAFRVSIQAKRAAARRRLHERKARDMGQGQSCGEAAVQELQAVLDEEIQHLTETYRAPFVLCCLEGKTRSEAARELGWKEGTVSGRLARARRQLRQRLTRRGISLSAALCVLALGPGALASPLVKTTVHAAILDAAGKGAAAGVVSSQVSLLVREVSKAMLVTKLKSVTAFVLLGLTVLGAGLLAHRALAAPQPAEVLPSAGQVSRPAPPAGAAKPDAQDRGKQKPVVEVAGRVLDPTGKAVKDARVHFCPDTDRLTPATLVSAVSGADGRFRLTFTAAEPERSGDRPRGRAAIVAVARGYGPAVAFNDRPAAVSNLTLRLVKDDVPIRGRILNLEGKPVAGVTVRVTGLRVSDRETLTPWLDAIQAGGKDGVRLEHQFFAELYFLKIADLYPPVQSGADGRFQITGVGRERIADVRLEGPTIETSRVRVRTRPGATIRLPEEERRPRGAKLTCYGAVFDHLAGPTLPVVGTVRDRDSGKPLAGVTVQSTKLPGNSAYGSGWVQAITDRQGRYRLVGLPKTGDNVIQALPAREQPYLAAKKAVGDCSGFQPVTVDLELKRGVLVKGRVTDRATGRPVRARVDYFYFADNPYRKEYPRVSDWNFKSTGQDGTFQQIVMPGRGLIAVRAWRGHYLMGLGADKIKGQDDQGLFRTYPHLCHASEYHAVIEINPAKGSGTVTCDVVLDPGRSVAGTVLGPDGKPLPGTLAVGLKASYSREPLKTAGFTLFNLRAGYPRTVAFLHEGKRLAGFLMVRGDEKAPLTVKLQPWATVTGRLVDANGLPRTGLRLTFLAGSGADRHLYSGVSSRLVAPDKDGKFRAEGLVPGMKYHLVTVKNHRITDWLLDGATFKPGEKKNLGDCPPRANK
jgi:RNA polymerase sigma factor (sigma-70 family)